MVGDRLLRLEIDVQLGSEPIAGHIRTDRGDAHDFIGMLELIGLLDAAREQPTPASPPDQDT